MGCEVFDHGFDADWLVVDVKPKPGLELPVPDAAQWCNPERPTTIVPSGVTNRRWEFMVMPGEKPEDIAQKDKVWELLSPWMKPEDGKLVRSATYNFRSRLARGWRKGRMLIAGDAAHVMPPFMGQGMCSGLRDAWNIAWKLDAVLSGEAPAVLLDTYEAERSPVVDAVIRISMEMGKVVCVPDTQAAADRDEAFFSGNVPPPPELPPLPNGVVNTDADGGLVGVAGQYMPHGIVSENASVTDAIDRLGAVVVPFSDARFTDTEGRITALFETTGAKAILVRPDFYAFGSAATAEEAEAMLTKAAAHFDLSGVETVA